jgi:predicted transcriptional regulator
MLAIRLPEKIEKRLDRLAKRTGRTKTYYATTSKTSTAPRRHWRKFVPDAANRFPSKK